MNEPIPHHTDTISTAPFQKSDIEKILKTTFVNGSGIKILSHGNESFTSIINAISSARHIICIEFYLFKDDYTGKKVAEALKKKASEGVDIYLLYDHFGSFLTSTRFWSDLKKHGIKVKVSNPFRWSAPRGYQYRNHKKLLIVDGTIAITGGFNIADEYHKSESLYNPWRDTGISLEGPIAKSLLTIFKNSWATWTGNRITWEPPAVACNPGIPVIPIFISSGRSRRKMRKLLEYSIRHSDKSILLTNAYFMPGRKIRRAMIAAAGNGVKLVLLLPGQSDIKSAYYAGRSLYSKLLKAGIEIYNYREAVLHAKTAVFDNSWSIIGSSNLDLQSMWRNEESNVGILDKQISQNMTDLFKKDLSSSIKIDAESWATRPFHEKILEKLCYFVMRKL
ncbi:MAG: hypothetical protein ISR96_11945 [Nitrospira sp.]|nr:hypothetical protein [bacterium]MBL7050216.1 hypothetical protein [Nitrospira sp.]